YLGQRSDVRLDSGKALHSLWSGTESGHHLIEYEKCAMLSAQLAQPLEKARNRLDQVHVACDRLDDDARNFIAELFERRLDSLQTIEVQHQRVLDELGRYPR